MQLDTSYLPRLIRLDDGHTIPYVGISGEMVFTSQFEDVPLTSVYMQEANQNGYQTQ